MSLAEWIRKRCNGEGQLLTESDYQEILPRSGLEDIKELKKDASVLERGTVSEESSSGIASCGHTLEPKMGGKCQRWGCANYAFTR